MLEFEIENEESEKEEKDEDPEQVLKRVSIEALDMDWIF